MEEKAVAAPASELTEIKFHFFTMLFTPLKEYDGLSSNEIILKVVNSINDQRKKGQIIIYDRYKNRKNSPPRYLYITNAQLVPGKRIRLTLALIRSGKQPFLRKKDSIELLPFDPELGEFTDLTNFYIDMNRPTAVVCAEFNHVGPRITDIEYYFRAMSTDYINLSRALNVDFLIESNIEETITNLSGIYDFDIKIEAKKYTEMDMETKPFLEEWGTLLSKIQPEFVRIEAFFLRQGKKIKKPSANSRLLTGIKGILKLLNKPNNSDAFDKFVVNYQDKDGNDQKFDLFDKKSEISVLVDLNKELKNKELYDMIKDDFDAFLIHRYGS